MTRNIPLTNSRTGLTYFDHEFLGAAREDVVQELLCELWDGHSILALAIGKDIEAGRAARWMRDGRARWISGCRHAAETMRAEVAYVLGRKRI